MLRSRACSALFSFIRFLVHSVPSLTPLCSVCSAWTRRITRLHSLNSQSVRNPLSSSRPCPSLPMPYRNQYRRQYQSSPMCFRNLCKLRGPQPSCTFRHSSRPFTSTRSMSSFRPKMRGWSATRGASPLLQRHHHHHHRRSAYGGTSTSASNSALLFARLAQMVLSSPQHDQPPESSNSELPPEIQPSTSPSPTITVSSKPNLSSQLAQLQLRA